MSDSCDVFPDLKKESQERRAANRENSARILEQSDVAFESKNAGAHLIVETSTATADFWPGTGKFTVRGSGKYGRGVFNLLKALGLKP